MKDLIRAEVLKLRTTRGAFLLLLEAVAINVFTVVAPGENALRESLSRSTSSKPF